MNRIIPEKLRDLSQLGPLLSNEDTSSQYIIDPVTLAKGICYFVTRLRIVSRYEDLREMGYRNGNYFHYIIESYEEVLACLMIRCEKAEREEIADRLCVVAGTAIELDQAILKYGKREISHIAMTSIARESAAAFASHKQFFAAVRDYWESEAATRANQYGIQHHADYATDRSPKTPQERVHLLVESVIGKEERLMALNQALLAMHEVADKRDHQMDNEVVCSILGISENKRKATEERLRKRLGTWRGRDTNEDDQKARADIFRRGIGLELRRTVREIDPKIFCHYKL